MPAPNQVPRKPFVWIGAKPLYVQDAAAGGEGVVRQNDVVMLTKTQAAGFSDCIKEPSAKERQAIEEIKDAQTAAVAAASSGAAAQTVWEEQTEGTNNRRGPETIRLAGSAPNPDIGRTEQEVHHPYKTTAAAEQSTQFGAPATRSRMQQLTDAGQPLPNQLSEEEQNQLEQAREEAKRARDEQVKEKQKQAQDASGEAAGAGPAAPSPAAGGVSIEPKERVIQKKEQEKEGSGSVSGHATSKS